VTPGPGSAQLQRVVGLGISLAIAVGGTVGVGILRLPGPIAAALGDVPLTIIVWIAGGLYATLGAVSVSELAAMLPSAGGFYVYARRAFGARVGFIVGWNDWIANTAAIAYISLTAAQYLAELFPRLAGHGQLLSLGALVVVTAVHWLGVRIGSGLQGAISALVGLTLLAVAVSCFAVPPKAASSVAAELPGSAAQLPLVSLAMMIAVGSALRSIVVTYDGWYSAIYLAEETTNPSHNLPRAMILCTTLATALYVLVNVGFVHALSLPVLASSTLPAADVARGLLPRGGAEIVTAISLITILSVLSATVLVTPRILYAIGRDGLFTERATRVSRSGTPRVALAVTSGAVAFLILTGTFERIAAIAATVYLFNYLSAYVAVFKLRRDEPDLPRPYHAWGYPWTTAVVIVGSLMLLAAVVIADIRSAGFAVLLIAISAPVYGWIARRRHQRAPVAPSAV
jgi:APA family basic amino acid/polyamine antiporter